MFEKSLNSISFASPLKSSLFSPEPKPTKLQNASTIQSPPVNTPSNGNRQDYSPFIIKNSFYTNSTSKTLNFLTEKKRKSSTKVYTPSPNVSKGEKFSDRFIPLNKGLNLLEKFNLANAINEDDENLNSTNLDKDSIYYQKCVNYNEVLKRNVLMSENSASSFFNNRSLTNCTSTSSSSNRSIKSNIFSFKTNSKQKQQTLSSMITHRKNPKQKAPFGKESYLDEEDNTLRWVRKHCHEYGFIIRYPDGKLDVTGITYEPWHFRYVGVELAQELKDLNLCLEEYMEILTAQEKKKDTPA